LKDRIIDARGKSCPEPVILAKKGIQANPEGISIFVDAAAARENVTRFGQNCGYKVSLEENQEGTLLTLRK
jgi:tRNA 2-thiouridine synthesizing protein A